MSGTAVCDGFLVTEMTYFIIPERFHVTRRFISTASLATSRAHHEGRLKLVDVGKRVCKVLASVRISSLASTISQFPVPNLNRGLLNQLVVVLVFLRNLRVGILAVS